MGRLTTHVLDTAQGRPGNNIEIRLRRRDGSDWVELLTAHTNDDGRVDGPLLDGEAFTTGEYELTFAAGTYFKASNLALTEPAFLDDVVVRFGVGNASEHYHVPLLISPYGYSTYRGS